jgi:diguanylate cyclase (GGDEF)-like protein
VHRVEQWRRQPDRFEWLSGYLHQHHLQPIMRISMAGLTALFSAEYAAMLLSSVGPHGLWPRAAIAASALNGVALSVLWLRRWPTLNQSRAYVVLANAGIAMACLAVSDPIVGLSGSFAFIVAGFYAALFHLGRASCYNAAIALTVAAMLGWRAISRGEDAVLAGCEFAILLVVSIGAPIMINAMLHIVAADIVRSDFDALTGLLNRSGFYRQTGRLIDQHAADDSGHLNIAMLDIDHFKRLNDDRGHAAGDKALIDVGHALHDSAGPDAVVARAGGEEFLVADVSLSEQATCAVRLCEAIVGTPHGITASVGSSATPINKLHNYDKPSVIEQMIAHADAAMYAAKAAGGNQHHRHRGPPL